MPQWDQWIEAIEDAKADADKHDATVAGLIITGDISEADDVIFQLERIVGVTRLPLYFVLGNHDFYHGLIATTRGEVVRIMRENEDLFYLTDTTPIEIAQDVFLIGDDGWGDATVGDYDGSPIRLHDFQLIADFVESRTADWPKLLHRLGKESADRLRDKLLALPERVRQVLVATHVPPQRESCWYEGKVSDDDWAPFFVCGQIGEVLEWYADRHPDVHLTVLCGHTHHQGVARIRDNLIIYTGSAVYGEPTVQSVINADADEVGLVDPKSGDT
ncbi:Calcineurin-like phosphoesterase superfamily domain protein [Stieleria varia]|uniref:Calcineurin-like phosphoesterase superfamily domain protein n=2 Tax=Stieleria varia TaxID=2528005 RepID=A0A5C6A513_9BACT|nr:Calcineurin-like phosphoesterase superfamily domain protein [Stieleria varia]